jgi:hypothetical protein
MEGTTNNGIPISVETVTEGVDTPPPTTAPAIPPGVSLIPPLNGAPVASQSAVPTIPPNPDRPTQFDIDQLKNELKGSLDEEQGLITRQIKLLTERQAIKTAIEKIKTDGQLAQLLEQKEMLEELTSIATSI